jgi:hypothetical protein
MEYSEIERRTLPVEEEKDIVPTSPDMNSFNLNYN